MHFFNDDGVTPGIQEVGMKQESKEYYGDLARFYDWRMNLLYFEHHKSQIIVLRCMADEF